MHSHNARLVNGGRDAKDVEHLVRLNLHVKVDGTMKSVLAKSRESRWSAPWIPNAVSRKLPA